MGDDCFQNSQVLLYHKSDLNYFICHILNTALETQTKAIGRTYKKSIHMIILCGIAKTLRRRPLQH